MDEEEEEEEEEEEKERGESEPTKLSYYSSCESIYSDIM